MKLKDLKMKNFAKFVDFEIEFDGRITNLVGTNGSGKTTVGLTSIWACLKGIAEKGKDGQLIGERFRFIGPNKATADIELTLTDGDHEITVKNHISKSGNNITFTATEGYNIDEAFLGDLLSVAFISAKNFSQLNSRDQSLLLGIDTEKFDFDLAALKQEFTEINRDIKRYGDLSTVEKVERVSVADLVDEKDKHDTFNNEQKAIAEQHSRSLEESNRLLFECNAMKAKLKELSDRHTVAQDKAKSMPTPADLKDTTELSESIRKAEGTNDAAVRYENWLVKTKELNDKNEHLTANKAKQEQVVAERLKFISSFDFGFKGLAVDDKGGLLLRDRPVKEPYFSKGELEIIVAKLHASQNPDLKVRFIDNFELLDEDNQKKLLDSLFKDDFQVITAVVAKEASTENSILLRECQIAGKEAEGEDIL